MKAGDREWTQVKTHPHEPEIWLPNDPRIKSMQNLNWYDYLKPGGNVEEVTSDMWDMRFNTQA